MSIIPGFLFKQSENAGGKFEVIQNSESFKPSLTSSLLVLSKSVSTSPVVKHN